MLQQTMTGVLEILTPGHITLESIEQSFHSIKQVSFSDYQRKATDFAMRREVPAGHRV